MHHISNLLKIIGLGAILCLIPLSSSAQEEPSQPQQPNAVTMPWMMVCGPREDVLTQLRDKFQEKIVFMGETHPGIYVSVWVNSETKSFSVIAVNKDHPLACIFGSGENYIYELEEVGEPT